MTARPLSEWTDEEVRWELMRIWMCGGPSEGDFLDFIHRLRVSERRAALLVAREAIQIKVTRKNDWLAAGECILCIEELADEKYPEPGG